MTFLVEDEDFNHLTDEEDAAEQAEFRRKRDIIWLELLVSYAPEFTKDYGVDGVGCVDSVDEYTLSRETERLILLEEELLDLFTGGYPEPL